MIPAPPLNPFELFAILGEVYDALHCCLSSLYRLHSCATEALWLRAAACEDAGKGFWLRATLRVARGAFGAEAVGALVLARLAALRVDMTGLWSGPSRQPGLQRWCLCW